MLLRPSTALCLILPKQNPSSGESFLEAADKVGGPAQVKISSQQQFPTHSTHNTHFLEKKPRAAFTTTMSDEFEEYIDWSKGDLLDACNDPTIGGMDLGR
jgi:hypothetical protein